MFTGFMKFAYHIKDRMRRTRYFIYMLMSIWKMLCFLCFMLVVMFFKGENVTQIFSLVNAAFSQHKIQVLEVIVNRIRVAWSNARKYNGVWPVRTSG